MTGDGWTIWRLGPLGTVALLAGVAVALPATAMIGCAAHEIGHGLVGTALGYEVERIVLCPGDAEVVWRPSQRPSIDTTLVPWAGGVVAAALLAGAYLLLARGGRPARSPVAWALGLPLAAVAALQLVVGILEGLMPSGYVAAIDAQPQLFLPAILGAGLLAAAAHVLAWRRVLRRAPRAGPASGRD